MLGAVALIGAALVAGACILNSLSEGERQRQEKLADNYENYKKRSDEEYRRIAASAQAQYSNYQAKSNREYWQARQDAIQDRKNVNAEAWKILKEEVDKQVREWEVMCENTKLAIEYLHREQDGKESQMLRKDLSESIRTQLYETLSIQKGYITYLNKYRRSAEKKFEYYGEILEPFHMRLPAEAPYFGKIMYFERDMLLQDEFWIEIHDRVSYLFSCEDKSYLEQHTELVHDIPCLVTRKEKFNEETGKNGAYYISCQKGALKLLFQLDPLVQIPAKVIGEILPEDIIFYDQYLLDYEGYKLRMNKGDSQQKKLRINSVRNVYVKNYDKRSLTWCNVTEIKEQCLKMETFRNVLLVLKKEHSQNFMDEVRRKGADKSEEPWYIGPYAQDDINFRHLKCQLGRQMVFSVVIETFQKEGSEYPYIRFDSILPDEEMFKASDIFIVLQANIQPLEEENLSSNSIDEFAGGVNLIFYLNSELMHQGMIKQNRENILFFNQWSIIMDRLVEVKESLASIVIGIESYENLHKLKILPSDLPNVQIFIEQAWKRSEGKVPSFYLSSKDGFISRCHFDNKGQFLLLQQNIHKNVLDEAAYTLILHQFTNPYPERQQKKAMADFIKGKVVNDKLRDLIFDLNHLLFHDEKTRVDKIINHSILSNESQLEAVVRSVAVKDFFMIQGPPGTGKTTVIKEIIWQERQNYPDSRILVVSQANVAVDNVLEGLLDIGFCEDEIIRCGNTGKISERVKKLSLEGRVARYLEKIRQEECEERLASFRKMWIDLIEKHSSYHLVGESVLSEFPIIGATCIGLAQKGFGLERLNFDLVIIDEAGKALPGELLLPINRAKKAIVIGDHKQLPPVVDPALMDRNKIDISDVIEDSESNFFKDSLFKKLYDLCPDTNKCMLNTQFRMTPQIGEMISSLFYCGKLKTADVCYKKIPLFFDSSLLFLNMDDKPDYREYNEKNERKTGPYNPVEVEIAIDAAKCIHKYYKNRIVIITPYKQQMYELRGKAKENNLTYLDINTIDAFQGDEEDVVIYCMTRAFYRTNYFSDSARINVALSRARNTLLIIGALSYLYSYGEGHPLYSIASLIKAKGRIITFDDLVQLTTCEVDPSKLIRHIQSDDIRLLKNTPVPFYDCEKYLIGSIPPNAVQCNVCGEYKNKDSLIQGICRTCLSNTEKYKCGHCGREIEFSHVDKYLLKKERPELCQRCTIIYQHKCKRCSNDFFVRGQDIERFPTKREEDFIYCEKCLRELWQYVVVGKCRECGQDIKLRRIKVEQLKEKGRDMPVYCKKCNIEEEVGICKDCGKPIMEKKEIIYQFEKNDWDFVRCARCRKEAKKNRSRN